MKSHIKIALVCLLAFLIWHPAVARETNPCAKHQDKRFVSGKEPMARKLYKAACLANAGPWANQFTEEDFAYLGELHDKAGHKYAIGFLSTEWDGNVRATNRLLVFSGDGKYLGRFSDQYMPPSLKPPYTLKFPNPAKWGNTVSFKNGIPSKIWVDGYNFSFERANKSSKRTR